MFYPELLKNYLRPYTQFPERALYSNSGNPYLFADLKKKKKTLNNLAVFPVKRPGLSGHHDLRPTPRPSHTDIPPPPASGDGKPRFRFPTAFRFPGFSPTWARGTPLPRPTPRHRGVCPARAAAAARLPVYPPRRRRARPRAGGTQPGLTGRGRGETTSLGVREAGGDAAPS